MRMASGDHSMERGDTENERCLEAKVGNEDPIPGLCDLSTGYCGQAPHLASEPLHLRKCKKQPPFPDDFTRFFVIVREVVYINTL